VENHTQPLAYTADESIKNQLGVYTGRKLGFCIKEWNFMGEY